MKKYLLIIAGSFFMCIGGYGMSQEESPISIEKEFPGKVGHRPCMEKPELIVFDFGKVLGGGVVNKVIEGVQRELQISYEAAEELVKGYAARTGSKKEYWKKCAQKAALPMNWKECFKKIKLEAIDVNRAVLKIVKNLHDQGYRLAVLSNTTAVRAERIRSLGAYDLFDPVVLSFEIGVSKPHPEAYEELLRQARVSAERCLFIDDKEKNIRAAAKLGFDTILFSSAAQLQSELEKRSLFGPGADFSEQ